MIKNKTVASTKPARNSARHVKESSLRQRVIFTSKSHLHVYPPPPPSPQLCQELQVKSNDVFLHISFMNEVSLTWMIHE